MVGGLKVARGRGGEKERKEEERELGGGGEVRRLGRKTWNRLGKEEPRRGAAVRSS